MLKFYWNGIRVDNGKLQLCHYSASQLLNHPADTITIYGKRYRDFCPAIHRAFTVSNGSDMQTDYFENDRIRVEPSHPCYAQVKAAYVAQELHHDKTSAKRYARCTEQQAA